VADEPRVRQVGLLASEDVVIGTANADAANPDQHLTGGSYRLRPVLRNQLAGL